MNYKQKIDIIGWPLFIGVRATLLAFALLVMASFYQLFRRLDFLDQFGELSLVNQMLVILIPLVSVFLTLLVWLGLRRFFSEKEMQAEFERVNDWMEQFIDDDLEFDVEELMPAATPSERARQDLSQLEIPKVVRLDLDHLTTATAFEQMEQEDIDRNIASPWLECVLNYFVEHGHAIETELKVFVAYQKQDLLGYHKQSQQAFYHPTAETSEFLEKVIGKKTLFVPGKTKEKGSERSYRELMVVLAKSLKLGYESQSILKRLDRLMRSNSKFFNLYHDFLLFRQSDFEFWKTLFYCQNRDVRYMVAEILRTIKEFYEILAATQGILGLANKISIYTEFAVAFTNIRLHCRKIGEYIQSNEFGESLTEAKSRFTEREVLVELATLYDAMDQEQKDKLTDDKRAVYLKAKDNLIRLDEFLVMAQAFEKVSEELSVVKELLNVDKIHSLSTMIQDLDKMVEKAKNQLSDSESDRYDKDYLDELVAQAKDKILKDNPIRIYSLMDEDSIKALRDLFFQVRDFMMKEFERLKLPIFDELSQMDDLGDL